MMYSKPKMKKQSNIEEDKLKDNLKVIKMYLSDEKFRKFQNLSIGIK